MASTSEGNPAPTEDLFITTRGTILIMRRLSAGGKRALLILPGKEERYNDALYEDVATGVLDGSTSAYVLELRGHGKSEGRWSLEEHRKDIEHVLQLLHSRYKSLYVVAAGASAQVMLELEHRESHLHGVVLLAPSVQAKMQPVRVQTPMTIFVRSHDDELLKKIFGPVRIRARWQQHTTDMERAHRAQLILKELRELFDAEKPIRFSMR